MTACLDADSLTDLLIVQCRATDYAGYDPFDGLNGSVFKQLKLGALPFAKIAWLQLHNRGISK